MVADQCTGHSRQYITTFGNILTTFCLLVVILVIIFICNMRCYLPSTSLPRKDISGKSSDYPVLVTSGRHRFYIMHACDEVHFCHRLRRVSRRWGKRSLERNGRATHFGVSIIDLYLHMTEHTKREKKKSKSLGKMAAQEKKTEGTEI